MYNENLKGLTGLLRELDTEIADAIFDIRSLADYEEVDPDLRIALYHQLTNAQMIFGKMVERSGGLPY